MTQHIPFSNDQEVEFLFGSEEAEFAEEEWKDDEDEDEGEWEFEVDEELWEEDEDDEDEDED